MNVGVFLCLEPYTSLENNLRLAHEYGFTHADITDTHSGGSMFASAGLSASVSLDDNPFEIRRTFERHGMKIDNMNATGRISINGEEFEARTANGLPVAEGNTVTVVDHDGRMMLVL